MIPVAVEAVADAGVDSGAPSVLCHTYHPRFRRSVMDWAATAPELSDLAETFPALLFAIATGYGTDDARRRTVELVMAGAPLRACAHVLDLPFWTRRLPPDAFTEPLDGLPLGMESGQRLATLVPSEPATAATWLSALQLGARCCHEDFALWIAGWADKHHRALATDQGQQTLRWLAAWAWHAGRHDTAAHILLRRGWIPAMGYRRALDEVVVWRQRILLAMALEASSPAPHVADGHHNGYDFVRLATATDFIAEAAAMDNCLDQFADRLMHGYSCVYSIRRNGRPVADVEIALHEQETCMPAIRQLRGSRNRRAAPAIWQAAYAWLGSRPLPTVKPQDWKPTPARSRSAARAFWSPYLHYLEDGGHSHDADAFRALVLPATSAARVPPGNRRPRSRTARRTERA